MKLPLITSLLEAKKVAVTVDQVPELVMKIANKALEVRHSHLEEINVGTSYATFALGVEFPEHRTGVLKGLKDELKGLSGINVTGRNMRGRMGDYALVVEMDWDTDITDAAADKLEADIKKISRN